MGIADVEEDCIDAACGAGCHGDVRGEDGSSRIEEVVEIVRKAPQQLGISPEAFGEA